MNQHSELQQTSERENEEDSGGGRAANDVLKRQRCALKRREQDDLVLDKIMSVIEKSGRRTEKREKK